MARPYSDDLRGRVAASIVSGRSARETARLFEVSVASGEVVETLAGDGKRGIAADGPQAAAFVGA